MEGHLVGSDENNIKGETSFRWLPGGFFLEQRVRIDFGGLQIDALELIGYDPETDTFRQPCIPTSRRCRCRTSGTCKATA